jgi:hypothetical protein
MTLIAIGAGVGGGVVFCLILIFIVLLRWRRRSEVNSDTLVETCFELFASKSIRTCRFTHRLAQSHCRVRIVVVYVCV